MKHKTQQKRCEQLPYGQLDLYSCVCERCLKGRITGFAFFSSTWALRLSTEIQHK